MTLAGHRTMANFDINEYMYIIAREKLFHPCKIVRSPYGFRLISYNAGQALYGMWRRKKNFFQCQFYL